jgi:hypothetical protein
MSIITVSGEMGSLRDELAMEICQRGGLECVGPAHPDGIGARIGGYLPG